MKELRQYSLLDKICLGIDQAWRAVSDTAKTTGRANPAEMLSESIMTAEQRQHSAALMRINHAGEVCAQALYHGQGLASSSLTIKTTMQLAAIEEGDHLAWCKQRLCELGSHTSYLNPFWYASSFTIGFAAGLVGDKWSLGFLAETEQQVVHHLEKHMAEVADQDQKSHAILQQMQQDEAEHRNAAMEAGANPLPSVVRQWMRAMSKIMVKTVYWV